MCESFLYYIPAAIARANLFAFASYHNSSDPAGALVFYPLLSR